MKLILELAHLQYLPSGNYKAATCCFQHFVSDYFVKGLNVKAGVLILCSCPIMQYLEVNDYK